MQGNHNHKSNESASGSCGCGILSDLRMVKGEEKPRPWRERKAASQAVARAYQCIAEDTGDASYQKYAERIGVCGHNLDFARIRGPKGVRRKLAAAMLCKNRLCTMCQWRRSQISGKQLEQVVEAHWQGAEAWGADGVVMRIEPAPNDKALFLTLTAESVTAENLPAEIERFYKAFDRMRRTKRLKSFVNSWFRSLEVTYNSVTKLYHPHFHVLLMVKPDYLTNPNYYMCQKKKNRDWSKMWGWALGVDYLPIVDVRRLKGSQAGQMNETVRKGIRELTKYCTKPLGIIQERNGEYSVDPDVLKALHISLSGRRLFGWGGKFKEARKVLQLQDAESDDADLVGSDGLKEGEVIEAIEHYGWKYCPETKRKEYLLLYESPPKGEGGENSRGKAQPPPTEGRRRPQTPLN